MTLDACQQDLPCVPQGKQAPGSLTTGLFAAGMRAQLDPSILTLHTVYLGLTRTPSECRGGRVLWPEWAHKLPHAPSWQVRIALTSLGAGPKNLAIRLHSWSSLDL